jgi:hypothetical protein
MDVFDGIDDDQEFFVSRLDNIFDFSNSHDACCPG